MTEQRQEKENVVYAIYIQPTNEFYIGRTCNPEQRFNAHLTSKSSPVHERAKKYGKDAIFMMILKHGLSYMDSRRYEAKYIFEFYYRLNLINQTLPATYNLLMFCETEEDIKKYEEIMTALDKEYESGNLRIPNRVVRNRDHYRFADTFRSDVIAKKKGKMTWAWA